MSEASQPLPPQSPAEIKQAAEDTLRRHLSALADTDSCPRPGNVEFAVILEDRTFRLFTNRKPARDWARAQNQAHLFGEFRSFELVELTDEQAVDRAAAL